MSCLIRAKSHQKQPHRSRHSAATAIFSNMSTLSEADGLTHLIMTVEATEGSQGQQMSDNTPLLNTAHGGSCHAQIESAR